MGVVTVYYNDHDPGACAWLRELIKAGLMLRGSEVIAADQVLVGKNATRRTYNARMRALRGFTDDMPEIGDRLVCLRNDKTLGIFNGGMFCVDGHVSNMTDHLHIGLELSSEDFPRRPPIMVRVRREFFNGTPEDIHWQELRGTQQFDFGYALTVHKAQGSQWGDVILYDESGIFREDARRFLYTGITRASETVTVVI